MPVFTKHIQSTQVAENSSLVLECQVTGVPRPTVSWFKNNESVEGMGGVVVMDGDEDGITCLKIDRLQRDHSGHYACRAKNDAGEASSTALIKVIRKFRFTV